MGWRNILIAELNDAVKQATEARRLVDAPAGEIDLDEVCRLLINLQTSVTGALGEIYNSCGPFFPRKDAIAPRDQKTVKCADCGDHFVPNSDPPKCPNCGTTHPARGEKS